VIPAKQEFIFSLII